MKQDNKEFFAVIMAGGGGTRLWPLSRKESPKQMLNLIGERTLFQIAVDRLIDIFPMENILVVTVAEQAEVLKKQYPEIPKENFILEPMPKGTASVVGLAAVAVNNRIKNATMAILTADHFIKDVAMFQNVLCSARELAQEGYLVTLGIKPTFPSTGYGYIQRTNEIGEYNHHKAFRVESFKEKPDQKKAAEFLARQDHDWNSGMFIWRVDRILEEIKRFLPDLSKKLDKIAGAWGTVSEKDELLSTWPEIIPETIDYGIMEKADKIAVFPVDGLGWNDVGSWESLFDVLPADKDGNLLIGANHIGLETNNSLVLNNEKERLVVTIGLEDVIVIQTKDAVLVCNREKTQDIKKVVNQLKEDHLEKYL